MKKIVFLSSYVLYHMFYECEEHKIWLINEMKCWILIVFFKKRKKDRYRFWQFTKLNSREMHNFPWFAKLNSREIKKISRKAWFAKFSDKVLPKSKWPTCSSYKRIGYEKKMFSPYENFTSFTISPQYFKKISQYFHFCRLSCFPLSKITMLVYQKWHFGSCSIWK